MELKTIGVRYGPFPKYVQIKEFLLEHIRENNFRSGALIPSENELARHFDVTSVTVSRALNELVAEGKLYRVRGKGTFVASSFHEKPPVYLYLRGNPFLDPYFSGPLVNAFAGALAQQQYFLTIKYLPQANPIDLPVKSHFSGAIVLTALDEADRLSEASARALRVPVIYVGAHPEEKFDYISFRNADGVADAMQHLVELGHRRIAFFSATDTNISNLERLRAYRAAVAGHDLAADDSLVFKGIYSKESGYDSAMRLLDSRHRPSAVLCSSDVIALGAIQAFKESGLNIPKDVSVIGFGDYEIASYAEPLLTTVHLPVAELGRELARLTIFRIEHSGSLALQQVLLPTKLVVRNSTGQCTENGRRT